MIFCFGFKIGGGGGGESVLGRLYGSFLGNLDRLFWVNVNRKRDEIVWIFYMLIYF